MSFPAPKFTTGGREMALRTLVGEKLIFTQIAIGDGQLGSLPPAAMTELAHEILRVNISKIQNSTSGFVSVRGSFTNAGLQTGFYWRELGVYAKMEGESEQLYCYSNAQELAEFIAAAGSEIIEKVISIPAVVGDAENVTAVIDESLVFATQEELAAKADKTLVNVTNEDFKAKAEEAGAGGVPPEMAARLVYSGPAVPGTPIVIPQDADTLEHKTLAQILTDTALTGSPTAPTPAQGDSSALIATTAFVSAAIIRLIGSAPGALDTLEELAAALGNDANFAATVTNLIAGKAAQADLTAHVADAVKHITAAERAAWNAKASAPVFGTYTGDGAESKLVSLGFRAKAVLVANQYGIMGYAGNGYNLYGGLALDGHPVVDYNGTAVVKIDNTGFYVYTNNVYIWTNELNRKYHYIAWR
ncbi:phage tail-collar fiber domain-containing protein [Intestinibacillus massiliensis]